MSLDIFVRILFGTLGGALTITGVMLVLAAILGPKL